MGASRLSTLTCVVWLLLLRTSVHAARDASGVVASRPKGALDAAVKAAAGGNVVVNAAATKSGTTKVSAVTKPKPGKAASPAKTTASPSKDKSSSKSPATGKAPSNTTSPPLSETAIRLAGMLKTIKTMQNYSIYVGTVKAVAYDKYLSKLKGYPLTFFVPTDDVMRTLLTSLGTVRFDLLKFWTLYGGYDKAKLDALPKGSKVTTLDEGLPVYKLDNNLFNGRPGDTFGAKILKDSIWYDVNDKLGTWVVHCVSGMMRP